RSGRRAGGELQRADCGRADRVAAFDEAREHCARIDDEAVAVVGAKPYGECVTADAAGVADRARIVMRIDAIDAAADCAAALVADDAASPQQNAGESSGDVAGVGDRYVRRDDAERV